MDIVNKGKQLLTPTLQGYSIIVPQPLVWNLLLATKNQTSCPKMGIYWHDLETTLNLDFK